MIFFDFRFSRVRSAMCAPGKLIRWCAAEEVDEGDDPVVCGCGSSLGKLIQ
jgi:hypothetical protein